VTLLYEMRRRMRARACGFASAEARIAMIVER
jgi:hypothetical protein